MTVTEKSTSNDTLRVLVVDDEQLTCRLIASVLARAGFTPVIATDGEEASQILEVSPVDVVITDLNMPRKNGLELLSEVQEKYPSLPVIVITGDCRIDLAAQCLRLGAFDCLHKPFRMDALKQGVARALGRATTPHSLGASRLSTK